jgi:hypothetical protein
MRYLAKILTWGTNVMPGSYGLEVIINNKEEQKDDFW